MGSHILISLGYCFDIYKMIKLFLILLPLSLLALTNSGFALKCMQCDGWFNGEHALCGENDEGHSTTCPDNSVCAKASCEVNSTLTTTLRSCADKEGAISGCQSGVDVGDGVSCTICACDTDNCNGATLTSIS